MTIVYDKDGNEFKVKHQIDVKEWLNNGYFLDNPKPKKEVEEIEEVNIDELILNLDSLKSSDLKILANHFDFAYVNKDETVDKIKSILSENLEDSKSE